MLFPLAKKVNTSNPFIAVYQYIAIGVLGVCFYMTGDLSSIGSTPKPIQAVGAASADINPSISKALAGKSVQEKEVFYKVYKGMADYCANTERVRDNVQIRDMMTEVYLNYNIQGEASKPFTDIVNKAYVESGLKENTALAPNRAKAGEVFNKIADSIKASIEVDLNSKK